MGEAVVTVIVAVIASGIFTGLGAAIYTSFRDRGHRSDNAWDQRDIYRKRYQEVFETLMTHRTLCHKVHDMAYKDMPRIPKEKS